MAPNAISFKLTRVWREFAQFLHGTIFPVYLYSTFINLK